MLPRISIRKKPKKGESLYSYFLRLSNGNGVAVLSLLNALKREGRHCITKNDINLLCFSPYQVIDINSLKRVTKATKEEIEKCSFSFLLSHFCSEGNLGNLRVISGYIRSTLYYCPKCLRDNKYLKLLWKIKNIDVCLEHQCKLLNSCPYCNKVINYKDITSIGQCPYCLKCLDSQETHNYYCEDQKWLQEQWVFLLEKNSNTVNLKELSMRLLYILNGENTDFLSRELINGLLKEPNRLAKLLQHARGTLLHSKTLHISFLLRILKKLNITFEQLYSVVVPDSFHGLIFDNKNTTKGVQRPQKPISPKKEKESIVKAVLEEYIKNDEDITVVKICENLGVSRGTIRNWGCNKIIAEYKEQQREIKILKKKNVITEKIYKFFSLQNEGIITAADVYRHLGVDRTILWRTAPEITAFVYHELKELKKKGVYT
ncbi:TniQ family protein [Neobacillus drentensis]|uniref:TniQ family protein n=1 Tax=Neobacillus drentensis TaxID=220684 RepID=UPI003000840D